MASYWNEILTAISAQVASIPGIPPVIRRKRPVFYQDAKRTICVSAVTDEIVPSEGTFAGPDMRRVVKINYTISVAILIQANEQYQSDETDPDYLTLEWREAIRQKLDQPRLSDLGAPPLPGADTVKNMDVILGSVYDEGAMNKAYNDSRITVVCESWEPANGPNLSTME